LLDITYHHSTTTVKNVAKEYNLSEKEVRKIIDSVYLKEKEIKVFKIVWLPSPYDEGIFINSLARPLYLKKIE
jgi:hypothetical protein